MINLTGELTIYAKVKEKRSGGTWTSYSTKISSKDNDGTWQSAFITVGFKKGVEVANKAKINVKNAFLSVESYNGNNSLKLVVLDFDVVSGGEGNSGAAAINMPIEEESPFMNVPEGELDEFPFGTI